MVLHFRQLMLQFLATDNDTLLRNNWSASLARGISYASPAQRKRLAGLEDMLELLWAVQISAEKRTHGTMMSDKKQMTLPHPLPSTRSSSSPGQRTFGILTAVTFRSSHDPPSLPQWRSLRVVRMRGEGFKPTPHCNFEYA